MNFKNPIPIGHKFGRLTILSLAGIKKYPSGAKHTLVRCMCDCGKKSTVHLNFLKRGHTNSCGCYQRQRITESHTKHGEARKGNESPLYKVWKSMNQRCNDPNSNTYRYYGKRGIKVVWNSFEDFRRDMSKDYRMGLTIDRKDNEGNYSKQNCRWVTQKEQNRNYGRNRILTYKGESLPMVVWAERCGITQGTFGNRIRSGWSINRAINTPIRGSL